jgi:hypothetical protein
MRRAISLRVECGKIGYNVRDLYSVKGQKQQKREHIICQRDITCTYKQITKH